MPSVSDQPHHLLEHFLQRREMQETSANNSARAPSEVVKFAASFAQERLWLLHRLTLTGSAYHITMGLRVAGALDIEALEKAFDELIRRHESLRTHFEENEDGVTQVINARQNFRVVHIDFSSLEVSTRDAEVARALEQHARRPFALSSGPLIRVTLFKLSAQHHVLLIALHHIVSDPWSMGIVAREVNALYTAFTRGEEPTLPELTIQYADYSVWQRQWLRGEVLERQMKYWRTRLADAPEALELPTDRPRPANANFAGATVPVSLPPGLSADLVTLSRKEQASLDMLLMAAYQILLGRWSGQTDLVVGSPVAGRTLRQTEDLIGLFVNMLPIRSKILDHLSFRDFLKQVREASLDAHSFQDIPFEKLVEEFQPESDPSRHPIFQVMFSLQNPPREPLQLGDLDIDATSGHGVAARYDLSLYLEEKPDGIQGRFEYATALFDRSTIERLSSHFAVLLEAIAKNPDRPLWQFPLIETEERERLLVQWNRTQREYDQELCVHELFSEQVMRTPDAVAVVYEDQSLTYAELNRKSNQLAWYLVERGVAPDQMVGICVERSLEMVIGLLGILKAGGAYVPMDPRYPRDRLAYMLADSRPKLVISQTSLESLLPDASIPRVMLDEQESEIAACPESNPDYTTRTSRQLAYVIYTSGSTGRPKGVMIEHANVVNFMDSMQTAPGIAPEDVLLGITSLSFDIAALEIFLPLLNGASVVLAAREDTISGERLMDLIEWWQVSIMQATPSTWRMLTEQPQWRAQRRPLKVLCGGEALPATLAERLLSRVPQVWNLYGPTETTIWSTLRCLTDPRPDIGRPISNTRVYILDEWLQPVPVGVSGELYIGGDGVARGYLNRAELTAERFIHDPFSSDSQERVRGMPRTGEAERPDPGQTVSAQRTHNRMYKTGDLGRWRSDGTIEYLRRNDHQVKIRGHRIELGEIEAQLTRHEQIKEAVVIAREGVGGEKRLVAYVVARETQASEAPLSAEALHAYLTIKLPEYMVPSVFVELAALPLSPTGKLDRTALPSPEGHSGDAYIAPRTPTEEFLAEIWAEVLELDRVGVHDNFFELGGHSMLTMKIVAKIFERTQINLPLGAVFDAPSVASMATYLAEAGTRGDDEVPAGFGGMVEFGEGTEGAIW